MPTCSMTVPSSMPDRPPSLRAMRRASSPWPEPPPKSGTRRSRLADTHLLDAARHGPHIRRMNTEDPFVIPEEASAAEAIATIAEEFSLLEGWEERYRHIIDLGLALPPFPAAWMDEAHR